MLRRDFALGHLLPLAKSSFLAYDLATLVSRTTSWQSPEEGLRKVGIHSHTVADLARGGVPLAVILWRAH